MRYLAWGASKLLELYLEDNPGHEFAVCVDSYSTRADICGVPVVRPESIDFAKLDGKVIVVFAASSTAVQAIFSILTRKGLRYRKDFELYSSFLFHDFAERARTAFGLAIGDDACRRYEAFVLNSIKPHHTTILGTVLIDAMMEQIDRTAIPGAIAEVGAFEGGNALALLTLNRCLSDRRYYVMDSFEGFPEISTQDPSAFGLGDYATKTPFEQIVNGFCEFDNVIVVKGFVPDSFSLLPDDIRFSLVFYDCDLYQPALDTFRFAWDRLNPGGYMVVHDYCAEAGGFEGVKVAVHEYFDTLPVTMVDFPQNTMAVIRKPLV